jgi:hypothetical protein
LSAALGCGGDGRPAEDTTCILRAGDSLLDELAFARVSTYPAHNLPAEIAALASDPIRVQVPVSPLAWERVEAMPAWLEQLMREHTTQELWWAQPPMPLLPDEKMPEIVVAGQRQPLWDPAVGREPPDGLAIWYPPETMMLALGNDRPMNVGLEGTVQPELEFGLFERGSGARAAEPASRAG